MAELSVRDKNKMVADIKVSYKRVRDIWKSAIEQSIEFGGELVYCKSQIEHGSWLRFLEVSAIPQRTANGAMRMYENRELLREKSAENWVDAVRIMQDETNPNRQRIADLTEPTKDPNGGCTSQLEVKDVPRMTSQSENPQEANAQGVSLLPEPPIPRLTSQAENLESVDDDDADDDDEEVRKHREQFDSSLEYATALTSYRQAIYVAELLASIDTDSREFELLRYEIWGAFFRKYSNNGDIAREKTLLFGQQFFDTPFDTTDASVVADFVVGLREDDEAAAEFLGCLIDSAGSRKDAIDWLKIMQLALCSADHQSAPEPTAPEPKMRSTDTEESDHPFDSAELGSILTDAIKTYCESVVCDDVDWSAIKETLTPVKWQLNALAGVNEREDEIEVSATVLHSLDASERQAFARKLPVMDTESAKRQALLQLSRIEKEVRELNPKRQETPGSDGILAWFTPED